MALMSQTSAIEKIRTETGLSEATATAMVKKLAKEFGEQDGKRVKVLPFYVERAIADVLRPAVAPKRERISNVKPFSPKLVNRIRRSGARV